jgi:hypothetical protein
MPENNFFENQSLSLYQELLNKATTEARNSCGYMDSLQSTVDNNSRINPVEYVELLESEMAHLQELRKRVKAENLDFSDIEKTNLAHEISIRKRRIKTYKRED